MGLIKTSFWVIVFTCSYTALFAQQTKMPDSVREGMALFQGEERFEEGGPPCLSCHSVTNENIATGGTFAKNLTDVYSRMGDGLGVWLSAPSFAPMMAAYKDHQLTEKERESLTAFLKYVNNAKGAEYSAEAGTTAYSLLIGGFLGLILLMGIFQFIWGKRKSKMVKQDIFDRSIKAFDAKF